MPFDPFRIQFLTVALDSQVVLTAVGLLVAGLAFGLAARRAGLPDLSAGAWWDVVTWAIVGGRALWVILHFDYYLRGPLQALVFTDGGLHPVGLVLGAGYAIWRLARQQPGGTRRQILECAAVAVLVTFLFERAGCALTTCGGGLPTDAPWALQRGDELRQPVALVQTIVLAGALLLATEVPRIAGRAFPVTVVALILVEILEVAWAGQGMDALAALLLVGGSWAATSIRAWRRTADWAKRPRPLSPHAPAG